MKNRLFNLLWGLSLLIFGIILLGNSLGLWFVDIFCCGWWILFIIMPALICICFNQHKGFNFGLFIIGILIMILYKNIWSVEFLVDLFLSLFVLIAGSMLISFVFKNDKDEGSNILVVNGICGLFKEKVSDRNLEVIKVNVFLGKLNLDIDSSLIKKDLKIKVLSIFGALRIVNASTVNVEFSGRNIGCAIKNDIGVHKRKLPTIYVEGLSIFSLLKMQK